MIAIGHLAALACPAVGGERPLRAPVQVDDGVETGRVEPANVGADRLAIIRTAGGGGRAVDAEPAIFVQRNANRVDVPGSHRGDRRGIIRTIEAAAAVHARVFAARPVDAEQPNRLAAAVNEMIADHPDGQCRRGGGDGRQRRDQDQGERD